MVFKYLWAFDRKIVMPYRRLPNTDTARLRAMKIAINKGASLTPENKPFSKSSNYNLTTIIPKFENAVKHQKEALKAQASKSGDYALKYKKARNYVSHFLQVMNLAIIRGDLKKNARKFYGLDENVKKIPLIKTEQDLVKWGDIVQEGETKRIMQGGNPMTNPTIGIVRVHYEKFIVAHRHQKQLQENYARFTAEVASLRKEVDEAIFNLWNEIEAFFSNLDDIEKRNICREFGLVYFFRRNEQIDERENVDDEYRKNRVINKAIREEEQRKKTSVEADTFDSISDEDEELNDDEKRNIQYSLF